MFNLIQWHVSELDRIGAAEEEEGEGEEAYVSIAH